jgi:hypothetical protein
VVKCTVNRDTRPKDGERGAARAGVTRHYVCVWPSHVATRAHLSPTTLANLHPTNGEFLTPSRPALATLHPPVWFGKLPQPVFGECAGYAWVGTAVGLLFDPGHPLTVYLPHTAAAAAHSALLAAETSSRCLSEASSICATLDGSTYGSSAGQRSSAGCRPRSLDGASQPSKARLITKRTSRTPRTHRRIQSWVHITLTRLPPTCQDIRSITCHTAAPPPPRLIYLRASSTTYSGRPAAAASMRP